MNSDEAWAQLHELIPLFYNDWSRLGAFALARRPLPAGFAELLDHHHHMTVTVESYFDQRVSVEVLETQRQLDHYSRKIVLRGDRDRRILMFGLVRLDLSVLSAEVRAEIESQAKPLGRVLIEHDVMRQVELLDLWRIDMGDDLQHALESPSTVTYGRTALIHCNGQPAVELLEIVTPDL
ncbi:MAG: hypothetical protein U0795_09115 [Pirellulales bacterium]